MTRYSLETKLSPQAAIARAVTYFGQGGVGLEVKEQGSCCATFEGGGGFVRVTASQGEQRTTVELETREWDYHVRRFLQEMG